MVEFKINLITLIDLLVLLQGIIIGGSLLFKTRAQHPSIFIGLFLITYSLELIPTILGDLDLLNDSPEWYFLPFNFYFLSFPFIYLYCLNIMSGIQKGAIFKELLPGIIEFVLFLVLFLLPKDVKSQIVSHSYYPIIFAVYFTLGCLFSAYYLVKILRLTNQYENRILNYFSQTENRLLSWIRYGSILLLSLLCSYLLFFIFPDENFDLLYAIVSLFNLIIIYYISTKAIRQVYSKIEENEDYSTENEFTLQNIIDYTKESKCFLNPHITILELSKNIDISPRELSSLINEEYANFNSFINSLRIEVAKKMLADMHLSKLSIEGIGYESGFKSKSAFYRAFKEFEGTSPGRFIA